MERTEKTWIMEIVLAAVVAAILAALLGLWGWTATKVVENGERIVEVEAKLQKEISDVRAELGKEIAELNVKFASLDAKMDLLISGLNIAVSPKESADAAPGAQRSFRVGAGETATG